MVWFRREHFISIYNAYMVYLCKGLFHSCFSRDYISLNSHWLIPSKTKKTQENRTFTFEQKQIYWVQCVTRVTRNLGEWQQTHYILGDAFTARLLDVGMGLHAFQVVDSGDELWASATLLVCEELQFTEDLHLSAWIWFFSRVSPVAWNRKHKVLGLRL